MGKMANYAKNLSSKTKATNGLLENFNYLKSLRAQMLVDIQEVSLVLKELNTELVNLDDVMFEIRETLSEQGVNVD